MLGKLFYFIVLVAPIDLSVRLRPGKTSQLYMFRAVGHASQAFVMRVRTLSKESPLRALVCECTTATRCTHFEQ